jgi:hypothetical protein
MGKVFDPFFTTKEAGRGHGLGLSMVYGFAKQSRGHIRITSEPGQGTTVKLFLPRCAKKFVEQPRAATTVTPTGSGELVLVVEDDPSVRSVVEKLLHLLGYRTLVADDAAQALSQLRETPDVKLLLSDVVLPGDMNGAELSGRAKAIRPGPNCPSCSCRATRTTR